jgi:predicted alpha/beta superfamily hydrolase
MLRRGTFVAWLAPVVLAIPCLASGQDVAEYSPVPLPASELRELHSEILQQDFRIYVQLPLMYNPRREQKYPVMYATDGNRAFPLVANISTVLGFPDSGFPQVVVVGIAYRIDSMADWAAWRTRDLTPTRNEGTEQYWTDLLLKMTGDESRTVQTGGAERFLAFITDELVPFIEAKYHVAADDRALGGYSYGGLFTLYALFERPGFFQRYFAGSPSLRHDDEVMFHIEEGFAATDEELQGRLFLTAGELEGEYVVGLVNRMAETLESRAYPGLEINTQVFDGEGHRSAYAASVMRAFTWLYAE